jgi:hypothetical protein
MWVIWRFKTELYTVMTRAYSGSHDTGVTEVLLVAFYNSTFWELIKEKEWGLHGLSLLTRPKEATAVVIDAYFSAPR